MSSYIPRNLTKKITVRLAGTPAVALLGPRQCGKTSLAKAILSIFPGSVYLDLERPSDLNKLSHPEAFFELHKESLVCLDEIQLRPELFPVLRSIIDESGRNGQLLILGSASRDLLRQSSESLAGRISYIELAPFNLSEWDGNLNDLWLRGGFPRSLLHHSDKESLHWRFDFIRSYLERDIPKMGFVVPVKPLERLWRMLAHSQGQLLNYSKLGQSLGVTDHTVKHYIDILKETFLVRLLQPYEANLKKRLVKTPKGYIRDSGILHALFRIESMDDLLGYPEYGASWEGFALEQILSVVDPSWEPFFYRDSTGTEIDLILISGRKKMFIEFKASTSPSVTRGFWTALDIIKPDSAWIAAPIKEAYPYRNGVMIAPLKDILKSLTSVE